MRRLLVTLASVAAAIAILAAVFVGSFYVAMQRKQRSTVVQVPDLSGLTVEAASAEAGPLHLVLQVVDQRHDPRMASGQILEQMPPKGTAVRRGRKIKIVLSLGGEVLRVPDLTGLPARTVAIGLAREGFQPGDEAQAYSYDLGAGIVMAQVPPPGSPAVPNTRVHRLVSRGTPPATWVMPDLSALDRAGAESWLSLHGFRRGAVRTLRVPGRGPGMVAGQAPLAGHPVRSRDIVELTVAE